MCDSAGPALPHPPRVLHNPPTRTRSNVAEALMKCHACGWQATALQGMPTGSMDGDLSAGACAGGALEAEMSHVPAHSATHRKLKCRI